MKKTTIKLNFPTGHLGASGSDDSLALVIRALSLKHGEKGSWADKYGADYEDDIICLHHDVQHPECSCDYESQEKQWLVDNPHLEGCFVSIAGLRVAEIERDHPLPEFCIFRNMGDCEVAEFVQFWHGGSGPTRAQKAEKEAKQQQFKKDSIAYGKACDARESAVRNAVMKIAAECGVKIERRYAHWEWGYRCTCGQNYRHGQWEKHHSHVKPCSYWWMDQPNFLHKPSGLEVRWYKYIGRYMKYNRQVLTPEEWRQIRSLVTLKDIRRVIGKAEKQHVAFAEMIAHANKQAAKHLGS
jgi:hypothetical protein